LGLYRRLSSVAGKLFLDRFLAKYIAARRFAEAVRSHWGIEKQPAPATRCDVPGGSVPHPQMPRRRQFNSLRRTALSMLTKESTLKVEIKNKRLTAG